MASNKPLSEYGDILRANGFKVTLAKDSWINVDYLDETHVNCIQLFNEAKNELLVVTEEQDADITFIHMTVKPEYDKDGKLDYLEDCDYIIHNEYTEDYRDNAWRDLVEFLLH